MIIINQTQQKLTLTEFLELPETKPPNEYINEKDG